MRHVGHDLTSRDAVAAQTVGHQAPRPELQAGQQALEEALGRGGVPAVLYHDVEHHAVLVGRAPKVKLDAVDPEEDLVEVPNVSRLRP
jgi:hypothetical protein